MGRVDSDGSCEEQLEASRVVPNTAVPLSRPGICLEVVLPEIEHN
jgi:hypothetical protein